MGQRVEAATLAADRAEQVRRRLEQSVAALGRMVDEGWFTGHADTVGLEVELDLVDPLGRPRLVNDPALDRLDRPDLQQELSQFNIELNVAPRPLRGPVLGDLERELASVLSRCDIGIAGLGARIVAIGMLPTLSATDLTYERLSANPRYALLSHRMRSARRRLFAVRIDGCESLTFAADSVAPEAAATSLQLHLRVSPERFAAFYNAAQAIAPIQVAVAANAPFLLGRQLWQETRIALCEQVLDTRRPVEVARGALPRAWLGDRWVSNAVELFADTVGRFPPLLPVIDAEDPEQALAARVAPQLSELRLQNGTVWRWNRPVYDVQGGRPHLRIENRVLPSGPTPVDMIANAALYYGLVRALADADPPVWAHTPFDAAEVDLHAAARCGLDVPVRWAGRTSPVRRLVLDELLPLAADGLARWQVDAADRDRYMGVVEARVRSGRTGASWQTQVVRQLEDHWGFDRPAALREMTRRYVEHARDGAPVHDWSVL
jgi:gamma-glutamylcysteine synthetase